MRYFLQYDTVQDNITEIYSEQNYHSEEYGIIRTNFYWRMRTEEGDSLGPHALPQIYRRQYY